MFCPKCKCEYREGFNFCSDCNIELVEVLLNEELPSDKFEYSELITIAETGDISIIPIVKSILDSYEIKYFIQGEMIRGIGVLNSIMQIQVHQEDATTAIELLKDLDIK